MHGAAIRSIRESELDELMELYRHLHIKDDPSPGHEELMSAWRKFLSSPATYCFVAEQDGRLVSSCTLVIVPNLTRGARPYGLIENVVTHRDYRRRGVGTAVLRHALDISWQSNCYKVMLMTGRKDPGVLAFYEQVGFRTGVKTGLIAYP